jgi:integrase
MRVPAIKRRIKNGKPYYYCNVDGSQRGLGGNKSEAVTAFAKLLSAGGGIKIDELRSKYLLHCEGYYVKNGKPTGETRGIKKAVSYVPRGPVNAFGPADLKAIQKQLATDYCRNTANAYKRKIVAMFVWGVSEGLVDPSVLAIKAVPGLKKHRTTARESDPVLPVPDAVITATLAHLGDPYADMVRFQLLTGSRTGEVCSITNDIDKSGSVWLAVLADHKTEHHGRERTIYIGPEAQKIIQPYLGNSRNVFTRKPAAYRAAIGKACIAAGVEHWSPGQLRHNAATRYRRDYGLEAAQVILGQSRADVTQIYAERDKNKAVSVMAIIG